MEHCQLPRWATDTGAGRIPRVLHNLRSAAASARRSRRCRHHETAAVPAIDEQLHSLRPACSAQRISSGISCGAPAVAVATIHAIDGCAQTGLSTHGDVVETLCAPCLTVLQQAMATYAGDKRVMATRRGTRPVCSTCGRHTGHLHCVFMVRPIGPAGLAS